MKAISAVFLLAAATASAQNPAPNVDRESDPARRAALEQKAAAAAAAAKSGDEEITFEQILAAPGDVELNERYAREQIRRGDLRGAATTLERVVMLAPQRDATRLLYAAVLYRLDDPTDAERELKIVMTRQPSGALHDEAKKYLGLVAASQRKTHFDARVSVGYGYDNNRNAAPDSGTRLFLGRGVALDSNSTHRSDTNVQFAGSLGVTREIGGANRHSVFARVGYFRGEQTLIDILDLQAYTARAGGLIHTRWADISPSIGFDHVLLSQSTYLRSLNAGVRVSRKLSRRSEAWTSLDREDQGFIKTPLLSTGDERRGDQYSWALGGLYVLTPFDRISATLGHRRKLAKAVRNAYRRESLGVEYTRLLGRGMFLVAGLTGDFDRYDRADNTVSETVRHDNAATAQLLYGAPLSLLWKPLDGFTGTLGYERFQQDSNLTNYKYSNNKLTALVSYAWGN